MINQSFDSSFWQGRIHGQAPIVLEMKSFPAWPVASGSARAIHATSRPARSGREVSHECRAKLFHADMGKGPSICRHLPRDRQNGEGVIFKENYFGERLTVRYAQTDTSIFTVTAALGTVFCDDALVAIDSSGLQGAIALAGFETDDSDGSQCWGNRRVSGGHPRKHR